MSPPNPASTPPPKEIPQPASASTPNTDEVDLAGAVDELLANIDAAGASLAQDLAADAPAPIESPGPESAAPEAAVPQAATQEIPSVQPAPQASEAPAPPEATQTETQSPPVESVTPQPSEPPTTPPAEASAVQAEAPPTHEALLAEVDALLQQANQAIEADAAQEPTPQPPPSPPGTRQPEAIEPPTPTPTPPPEPPKPAPTPTVAAIPAEAAETILAVDEEVCRLADRLLEQPAGAEVEAPKAAPTAAPAAAAPPTTTPSKESTTASVEPEPRPRRKIEIGATFAQLGSSASPLLVKVLAPLSAPLAGKPSTVRQSMGWIACSTVFFSAVLWGVVLTRKPATMVHDDGTYDFKDGPPPQLPVAITEESHSKGEQAKSEGEHGEASSEHGEGAAKSDAHGGSKAKPPAKKPPRKNKVASKAKKPPPPAEHE